jgi:tetratricopeptide (TPR) repeat protein
MSTRLPVRTVRPEPVEGLSFFSLRRKKGQGFDRLSPNGWGLRGLVSLALLLAACSGGSGTAYERGMAALEAGDLRTARVEFMNAIQADPDNAAARIMQARVMIGLNDGAGAEAEIARARQSGAPVDRTRHLMAHARLLQGDAQGALAEAEAAPVEHEAYAARIRGQAWLRIGDQANAAAAFERALALAPEDGGTWVEVGRFRRASGDIGGAIVAADRAVAAARQSVDALLLRAELTRGQYGLAAALPWFDRALEVDPAHVGARLERAITYGDMGRMREMLADAREVHRLTGGHPQAYYLQAVLAARARNFTLARSLYDRTRGAFDDMPAGMLLASAIDFETGNVERAAQRLETLVERQGGNRKARRLLAAARWRLGDAPGAMAALAPFVDLPDADSYSLSLMGRALARIGDAARASHYLARAANPSPPALAAIEHIDDAAFARLREEATQRANDGPFQVRFVSALLARGLGEEALNRARLLQRANPGAPEAHLLVGDALGVRGDFAGAAEQYRRAANIAFSEGVALRLIEALQRSGQAEAAGQVLALFLRQNPRNVPALNIHANRAMLAQDWASAIRAYESLRARLGDNDATVLNNLAWAYSETGALDRAVPLARRAHALDPDNPVMADTLGWILFKTGRRAEGLVLLEQAARGAPSDADIRRRLVQARAG